MFVERRQRRARVFDLRGEALDIDVSRRAMCATLLGQREHPLFDFRRALRKRQALLLVTQIDISLRDFRRERHLRVGEVGVDRVRFRGRSFDSASRTAEQIDLPRRIEACCVELKRSSTRRGRAALRRGQRTEIRLTQAQRGSIDRALRHAVRFLVLQLRA